MSATIDPSLKSWVEIKPDSDFTIHNIPFGVYTDEEVEHHACTAIGELVVDLAAVARFGYFEFLEIDEHVFNAADLNNFISLGKEKTSAVRKKLIELLSEGSTEIQESEFRKKKIFKKQADV
ncbi:MAG: fumarylacetoacetase, partial [Bacteroidia bacterium]|nr:fumarylacetoacetase [Bacteroidia bacterium]